MSLTTLRLERRDDGVAVVVLDRPELQNALGPVMMGELTGVLDDIGRDDKIRAVVLKGEGKSFCAGADPGWTAAMAGFSAAESEADCTATAALLRTMDQIPQPTLVAVQGAVIGIGVGLVACCDIAIAAEDATFAISDVRLGLPPAIVLPFVVGAMGARMAGRWLLSAERFDAAMALRCELVHQVVASRKLDRAAEVLLARLLEGGPAAQRTTKRLLRQSRSEELPMIASQARQGAEGQEGLKAFLESRRPLWGPP